jgi:Ca2+-binding RTX toxin-like protein
VVFGRDFSGVVTEHADPGGALLQGDAAANILVGNRGPDRLRGAGGQDVLRGGAADDVLEISDLTFRRVVGGRGHDMLVLDNSSNVILDLITRPDNRITGIEAIDITGGPLAANVLVLDKKEVLRISSDRNVQGDANTLLVLGDGGDVLQLPPGWVKQGTETIFFQDFDVYTTAGPAVIKVSVDVMVTSLPFNARMDVALLDAPTTSFDDPDTGELGVLPESDAWIHEWEPFGLEIWVSNADAQGVPVGSASLEVTFNTDYFSYHTIDYGPAFAQGLAPTIDEAGGRISLTAVATRDDAGDDLPALLARVRFRATANDPGVEHNADDQYVWSVVDLNLAVENAEMIPFGGGDPDDPEMGQMPQTEVWPLQYDVNDNGLVDLGDAAIVGSAYGDQIGDSLFSWQADFNHDGVVNFSDSLWLRNNYNKGREAGADIQLPADFPSAWLPSLVRAESAPPTTSDAAMLTAELLAPLVSAAAERIESVLGSEAGDVLDGVSVEIADLPGNVLGSARDNTVQIDVDAAGFGWFVDVTPDDDVEFVSSVAPHQLQAVDGPAVGRVDLLTVVMHELAHVLGFEDTHGDDLMGELLPASTRRLMTTDLAFAEDVGGPEMHWGGTAHDAEALDGVFAGL